MTGDEQLTGVDPFSVELSVMHAAQPVDGGVARYVREAAAYQADRGWRVTVAGTLPLDARDNLRQVPWHSDRNPLRGVRSEARALSDIVTDAGPDVVVLHSAKAGLVGRLALRGSLPTVYLPHCWSFNALPGPAAIAGVTWEVVAARWTNAVVAVSEGEAEQGVGRGIRAPMFVVPNSGQRWRGDHASTPAEARRRMGLSPGPTVVCVGRVTRQKGQDVLLDAWRRVSATQPGARLYVVGDGPWRRQLESRGMSGVRFVGESSDVQSYLRAADVVVIPSRWEGMSLAMLEAMAAGRPVVTTAVAGSDVVAKAGAGAVVPIGRAAALADQLLRRLGDSALAQQEGTRAADYVSRHHTVEGTYHALSSVVLRAYAFGRGRPT